MSAVIQAHKQVIQTRLEIRERALLYAEHQLYTQTQISGGQVCVVYRNTWHKLVKQIEEELLSREHPALARLEINKWQPLNLVFGDHGTK